MAAAKTKAKPGKAASGHPSPEHVWVALSQCYRLMAQLVEGSFAGKSLVLTDFMLLEALLHTGPQTITEIQGKVLLATGSMTVAVDRLERKGLIVRRAVEGDRRARALELTPEGRRTIVAVYAQHSADLRDWMEVLSPGDRAAAFKLLRKLGRHAAGLLAGGNSTVSPRRGRKPRPASTEG